MDYYIIITGKTLDELQQNVNQERQINNASGQVLCLYFAVGGPIQIKTGFFSHTWGQAMVRKNTQ